MPKLPAVRFRLPTVFGLVVLLGLFATGYQRLSQVEVERSGRMCWHARVQFETALGMDIASILRCRPREVPITADVVALAELGFYGYEPIFKWVCPSGSEGGGFKYFRYEGDELVCALHGRRNQLPKDPPVSVPTPDRKPLARPLVEALERRADVRHAIWSNYYNRHGQPARAGSKGETTVSESLEILDRRAAELDAMARALP